MKLDYFRNSKLMNFAIIYIKFGKKSLYIIPEYSVAGHDLTLCNKYLSIHSNRLKEFYMRKFTKYKGDIRKRGAL